MKTIALTTLLALAADACTTETPSAVVVDNDYPTVADAGDPTTEMTVYKVWWATTFLSDAVSPGAEGQAQRTVPNTDFAYAVLAPGWDPSSAKPPTRFVAAKSAQKLGLARGDVLHVHVSDGTFDGNCAAAKPLSQEDADLITKSIFPDEFAGARYDATRCSLAPTADAGDDGDRASEASMGGEGALTLQDGGLDME